jgi:hypothetical protein
MRTDLGTIHDTRMVLIGNSKSGLPIILGDKQ